MQRDTVEKFFAYRLDLVEGLWFEGLKLGLPWSRLQIRIPRSKDKWGFSKRPFCRRKGFVWVGWRRQKDSNEWSEVDRTDGSWQMGSKSAEDLTKNLWIRTWCVTEKTTQYGCQWRRKGKKCGPFRASLYAPVKAKQEQPAHPSTKVTVGSPTESPPFL